MKTTQFVIFVTCVSMSSVMAAEGSYPSISQQTSLPAAEMLRFAAPELQPPNFKEILRAKLPPDAVIGGTHNDSEGKIADKIYRTRMPISNYKFDIDAGQSLDVSKKPFALYYPIESAGNPVSGLFLSMVDDRPYIALLGPNQLVKELPKALAELRQMEQIKSSVFEVRLLQIRLSQTQAIWLKSIPAGLDYIYPLGATTGYGLKPQTLYSINDFLTIALPHIKQANAVIRGSGGR
jgi:hypothetical protein